MNRKLEITKEEASTPGQVILELLAENNMTQMELAQSLDISVEEVIDLLAGRRAIEEEIALKLADLFGQPANYWLKLEKEQD
ncbi:MAG: HigA family addiction module antitoxin [Bacillota bacterium]